jgi:hypothetical protein
MGSVSSTSSNLSNLLQTLSAASPQLSSLLSTSQMQSALDKASPGDLAQLSDQALQLQQVGSMFGGVDGTQSTGLTSALDNLFSVPPPDGTTIQPDPILQLLESLVGATGANDGTSSSAGSNQVAGSAISFQAQELSSLFGATRPVDPLL